jgi:hypothetical protein
MKQGEEEDVIPKHLTLEEMYEFKGTEAELVEQAKVLKELEDRERRKALLDALKKEFAERMQRWTQR